MVGCYFFPCYLKLHDGQGAAFLNNFQCSWNMIGCSLDVTDTVLVAQRLRDTVSELCAYREVI